MKEDNKQSKGLGDTVEKFLKNMSNMVGVELPKCKPCEERRKKLNEKIPYKKKGQQ